MKRIAQFLFEVGVLKKVARSHRQSFLTNDLTDNIATHAHRVSAIGYMLAVEEGADIGKVLTMCLFHDIGEVRSGDQNWVHKRYVKVFDEQILEEQLKGLTKDDALFTTMSEYEERSSLESHITKDADRLDQVLLLKEYALQGNKEAESWLEDNIDGSLLTESAKKLYAEIVTTHPNEWRKDLWQEARR